MKKFALPPVYLLVTIIAMAWVNYIFPFINFFEGNIRYMGFMVILGGIAIILIAARLFNKADTPIRPFKKPETLITDGLYKFSRNPVYLGMIVILIGFGMFLGSLTSFLVIPAFIWAIQTNFIILEEQLLLNTFGKEYADYLSRVRRWL